MKKYIMLFLLLLLLSGCAGRPAAKYINTLSDNTEKNIVASVKDSSEPMNGNIDIATLNIILPKNWHLDTSNKAQYNFVNDKGENKGWVISNKYGVNFDFANIKPNHSSVINDEYIDIPLGKCRLLTLDADNGTAASGITGTHNDYYAVITIKDKVIYVLEFSQNDKNPQTKEQFIEILKNLSINK